MNTIAKVCKQIVRDSIDHDYIENLCKPGLASLASVYITEYGYNGVTPKACKDYLQGLPTVCTVPFYNGEILEILEQHGIDVPQDDDGQSDMIDAYWLECGKQFCLMIA